jgi:L-malate glycosyltransferase
MLMPAVAPSNAAGDMDFAIKQNTIARPTACQLLHTLKVGGAEVLAAQLARQLKHAYRFVFVCLDELGTLGAELRSEGFQVEVLERRPGVDWRCMLRLAALLRRERVDLLHAHQYTPFFYSVTARLLGRRLPVRKRMLANRLLLGKRDRVVGVGEAVRRALIANEGIPAERVSVIYNGINCDAFGNHCKERAEVRREIQLGANDLVIILVARLDYLKDHATAVRTLKHVVAQRPDARLLLIGEGPEREKIEHEVQECDLAGNVRFLGLRKDVARLLAAADVFLLTSISEGIPVTVLEAMSAGLPVVATRVGGVPEVLEEGETGLMAPAGDAPQLADCVLRLATDPVLRARLARQGRQRAEVQFSQSRMHSGYLQLYQEMLHA